MNSVAAVIVTHDRKELLLQCIVHVMHQAGAVCDLLIIDNDSTDGTEEAVKELADTNVFYFNTQANLGGAGGFNYGLRKAYERGYEYFWLMDDDTLPEKNALASLLDADAVLRGENGFLSSKAVWTDGSICKMNVQRITPYRDVNFSNEIRVPIVMASFVSLFLRREIIRRYGLPISDFFIWGDDWEYTRRISKRENCYLISSSQVVHAMKSNSVVNIAIDTMERTDRYAYAYRNDVYLYRREGLRGWVWILAKYLWHSAQVLAKSKDWKMRRILTIWNGFLSGIGFHPVIEYVEQDVF